MRSAPSAASAARRAPRSASSRSRSSRAAAPKRSRTAATARSTAATRVANACRSAASRRSSAALSTDDARPAASSRRACSDRVGGRLGQLLAPDQLGAQQDPLALQRLAPLALGRRAQPLVLQRRARPLALGRDGRQLGLGLGEPLAQLGQLGARQLARRRRLALGLQPLLLLGPLALARAAQVALEALDLRPQRVALGRDLAQPAVGLEEPQLQRRVLADLGAASAPRGQDLRVDDVAALGRRLRHPGGRLGPRPDEFAPERLSP